MIVLGEGNAEDYGGDIFEAVDPLLAFGSLAANVEHTASYWVSSEALTLANWGARRGAWGMDIGLQRKSSILYA